MDKARVWGLFYGYREVACKKWCVIMIIKQNIPMKIAESCHLLDDASNADRLRVASICIEPEYTLIHELCY